MNRKTNRISELDALRGIAAVSVMLLHYTVRWFEQPGPPGIPVGEYAAHLFFMISGFVILMSFRNTHSGADFIVARATRLYPAYWAAVLIIAAVSTWIPPFEKSTVTMPQVLINLTMLQQWFHVIDVDDIFWTLAIELAFYGWLLLFFKLRTLQHIERIGAIWITVELFARAWERMQMAVPTLDPNIIPQVVSRSLLLEHGHLFIAGAIFCRIRTEGATIGRALLLGGCLLAHFFIYGPLAAPVIGLYFGVFLLVAKRHLHWLAIRPLVFLGSISYSLFLVHQTVGYAVMRQLPTQPHAMQVAAAITVSVLLAILLTYVVEKPSLRFIRTRWKARRSARTDCDASSSK